MNNSISSHKDTTLDNNKRYIQPKDIFLLLLPLLCGAISIWVWNYEITSKSGLSVFGWVDQSRWVVGLIICLIVTAYLLPQIVLLKIPFLWAIFYFLLLFLTAVEAYILSKSIFIALYKCRADLIPCHQNLVAWAIWKLLAIAGSVSVIFFIPIRQFHHKTDGMHILTILVAIVAVVPASLISLEWLHSWAYSTHFVFVYATKLGYPVLWLPIFLGIFSVATAKEWV